MLTAQMLWVGGLWLLHLGCCRCWHDWPGAVADRSEIEGLLSALLVGFAAACVTLSQRWCCQAEGLGVYGGIFAGNCC